jgi:hypothetical protein
MRHTLWIEWYFQKVSKLIDQLLRKPGGASTSLRASGGIAVSDALLVALPLAALYGVGMGLGAGMRTAMYNGMKLSIVLTASAAICLPSFYVFSALAGSRFSMREATRAIAGYVVITSVIWAALAPVTGFFTASVSSGGFLVTLHIIAIFLGFALGGSILGRALTSTTTRQPLIPETASLDEVLELDLEKRVEETKAARVSPAFYVIWFIVYAAVVSQLFVDFTPYLESHSFWRAERALFLDVAQQAFH